MSLVTAIRDFVDLINSNINIGSNEIFDTFLFVFKEAFFYFLASIKNGLFYFINFQWLTDLIYLPIGIPSWFVSFILEMNLFPLGSPANPFLTIIETSTFVNNKFFLGFLNSLFLSLPISCAHLLSGRRLLIQGIPAGMAAGLGTICGHSWFLASVLFGFRFFIIPWFSLEPLNYFLGIFILLNVIYGMAHERAIRRIRLSEKFKLISFFAINFFLTWCEQSSIFQYFGNLTAGSEPSYIENFFAISELTSIKIHGSYLVGFFLGSCFFSTFFAFSAFALKKVWLDLSNMTTSRLINKLNVCFLILVVAFSFTSVPYYGIDYLFVKNLGFFPKDKTFQQTVFSPQTMKDVSRCLGPYSAFNSFDTDVAAFDNGLYMQLPVFQSFEDLNYQGEYAWTTRSEKVNLDRGDRYARNFSKKWSKLFGPPSITSELTTEKKKEIEASISSKSNINEINISKIKKGQIFHDKKDVNQYDWEDNEFEQNLPKSVENSRLEYESVENQDLFDLFFYFFEPGFSPLFNSLDDSPPFVEKKIKNKFYENPIFQTLLKLDIDAFLGGHPNSHSLTSREENQLFKKRQMLGHYYDSLRQYNEFQKNNIFNNVYYGSKSYADRIYNQQFKGTLKVVRRLFSITLDPEENPTQTRVLKFDQPLFKNLEKKNEMVDDTKNKKTSIDEKVFNRKNNNVYYGSTTYHEELVRSDSYGSKNYQKKFVEVDKTNSPFLEITNPRPFYAGWDEQLRKLVITNRFLPRYLTTHAIRVPIKNYVSEFKPYSDLFEDKSESLYKKKVLKVINQENYKESILYDSTKVILFTAWPIPRFIIENPNYSKITSEVASSNKERAANPQLQDRIDILAEPDFVFNDWRMYSWPENLRLSFFNKKNSLIPPTRGGFVWPGSSELKINMKIFLPSIKQFLLNLF